MTDVFDNAEFWLQQEILTESDSEISPEFGSGGRKMSSLGAVYDADSKLQALFPFEFPYSSGFEEAPLDSSETESDEEERLAELTRHLTRSSLEDELNRLDSVAASKTNSTGAWVSSGSPQSTLCTAWNGCSCGGQGSSRGSPNAQSSPPTFDLLHAAAGEVSKMRAHEEALVFNRKSRSMLREPVSDFAYYLKQQQQQSLAHLQFERSRQEQILKDNLAAAIALSQAKKRLQLHQQQQQHIMLQNRARNTNNMPLGLSSTAWPPLHQAQQQQFQPNGPIFGAAAKKESIGTGVFLPRQIGATQTEYPRGKKQHKPKQASPVFVPSKVMHALKLNAKEICIQSKLEMPNNRVNRSSPSDYELGLRLENNSIASARSLMRQQVNNEIRLPQEWTY